jgi:DNA-binding GntR family transcriptional regulator
MYDLDRKERFPQKVQDAVYKALRGSIIDLNLAPGTAISEKEISLLFNVSRTPVREAFIHLSKEGLVRVIPQKETQVSFIDSRRVEQEFFLRESLETAALEIVLRKDNSAYFEEMEHLINLQSAALEKKAYREFIDFDDRFHRILFQAAGQELSWEVLSCMSGHYHRARMLSIRLEGIAGEKVEQHRQILRGLKEKNPEKVRQTLYFHMHNLVTEEKILRARFPDFFAREKKNAFEVDFGGLPLPMK